MPATSRGESAHSRADVELATWLTAQGRPTRPSRVAGWRANRMLPAPEGTGVRAEGPPGRIPATWSAAQLQGVRSLALRLHELTGRGRSAGRATLVAAAEGLPAPPGTVLWRAIEQVEDIRARLVAHVGVTDQVLSLPPGDPGGIDDALDLYVDTHPGMETTLARRLGPSEHDDGDADPQSVVYLLLGAIFGRAPDPGDTASLRLTMRALGMEGLSDPVGGPGGPSVVDGPDDVAVAVSALAPAAVRAALFAMDAALVHAALSAVSRLGRAMSNDPEAIALHLGLFAVLVRDLGAKGVADAFETVCSALEAQPWNG